MGKLLLIITLMAWAIAGCGRSEGRLQEIDALAEVDGAGALAALDSIEAGELGKADRMLYELIRLKAQDKAYVRQASDSVARMLAEYFRGSDREAEALYYCGRVNCDLGDYPTALRYFNEAESSLEKQGNSGNLYLSVLSQKGRLLDRLGLTGEAIDYGKRTIELSRSLGDTVNLHYDHELLAQMYLHSGELDSAESEIEKAFRVRPLPEEEVARLKVYAAGIKFEKGKYDEAIKQIRGTILKTDSLVRPFALAYASDIYRAVGKADTAMVYALELLKEKDTSNHITAYKVLLSPELSKGRTQKMTDSLLTTYLSVLDKRYNERDGMFASQQENMYNYARYEEGYRKTVEERDRQKIFIAILIGIISLLLLLYFKKQNSRLKRAFWMQDRILQVFVNPSMDSKADAGEKYLSQTVKRDVDPVKMTTLMIENGQDAETNMIDGEQKEIGEIHHDDAESVVMPQNRSQRTPSYKVRHSEREGRKLIKRFVANQVLLHDMSPYWKEIERQVQKESSEFTQRLVTLSTDNLTKEQIRLAYLIKCGATPGDVAKLLGRDKSTITKRRKQLMENLFTEKSDLRIMDDLIREL